MNTFTMKLSHVYKYYITIYYTGESEKKHPTVCSSISISPSFDLGRSGERAISVVNIVQQAESGNRVLQAW